MLVNTNIQSQTGVSLSNSQPTLTAQDICNGSKKNFICWMRDRTLFGYSYTNFLHAKLFHVLTALLLNFR